MMERLSPRGPIARLTALLVFAFVGSALLNAFSSPPVQAKPNTNGNARSDLFWWNTDDTVIEVPEVDAAAVQRQEALVNIMFGVSGPEVFAVGGCILSILAHTMTPSNRVCFYVTVTTQDEAVFADSMLRDILRDVDGLCLQIGVFDFFPNNMWMYDTRPDLYSTVNYARFYIHELYPDVHRMVYIDYDTVVQADISELYNTDMQGYGLAAVENCEFDLRLYLDLNFEHPLISNRYQASGCSFIAGVLLVDVDFWVKNRVLAQLEFIMEANLQSWPDFIYQRGSQSPLCLVFSGRFAKLDPLWQVYDLGWESPNPPTPYMLEHGKILHWNGPRKPWTSKPLYADKWRPLFPEFERFMNLTAPVPPSVPILHDIPTRNKLMPSPRQGVIVMGLPPTVGKIIARFIGLLGLDAVDLDFDSKMGSNKTAYLSREHMTNGIDYLEELKRDHMPWVGADSSGSAASLVRRNVFFKILKVLAFRQESRLEFSSPDDANKLKELCNVMTWTPSGPLFGMDVDSVAENPTKWLTAMTTTLKNNFSQVRITPVSRIPKGTIDALVKELKDALATFKNVPSACRNTYNAFRGNLLSIE